MWSMASAGNGFMIAKRFGKLQREYSFTLKFPFSNFEIDLKPGHA